MYRAYGKRPVPRSDVEESKRKLPDNWKDPTVSSIEVNSPANLEVEAKNTTVEIPC